VPVAERKARARVLAALSQERLEQRFIKVLQSGLTVAKDVLWESHFQGRDDGWKLSGLTTNYERVIACASESSGALLNQVGSARILDYTIDRASQEVHWNAEVIQ
jgi:hypothetical protein